MSEILIGWFLISAAVGVAVAGPKHIDVGLAIALFLAGAGLIVSGVLG